MKLDKEQLYQEDDFKLPYHWLIEKNTIGHRLYFGYLDICIDFISDLDKEKIKILDAGCGDGRFESYLVEKGFKDVSGVDYSEKAIKFSKLLVPEANFYCQNLEDRTDFPENNFDVVFLVETLEHIKPDKINKMLEEIKRILKPSGRLIITVPSILKPLSKKHYQHFSEKTLRDTLELYFEVKKIVGQNAMGFHPLKIIGRLSDSKYIKFKSLFAWYNTKIWHKYFNYSPIHKAPRLIALCEKNKI